MPIIFFDVETTGLDPLRHEIWELACIVRDHPDLPQDHAFAVQLNADLKTADPIALRISGYYQRYLDVSGPFMWTYPPAKERNYDIYTYGPEHGRAPFAAMLARLFAGATVVGSNPAFDIGFLARFLNRHGQCLTNDYHLIDVRPLMLGFQHGVNVGYAAGYNAAGPLSQVDGRADRFTPGLHAATGNIASDLDIEQPESEKHTALGDARFAMACFDRVFG